MRFHRWFRVAVVVGAALVASACTSIRQIGQAQAAFNAGAAAEAAPASAVLGDDTLVRQRAESSYRVARALVTTEIGTNGADLRGDGLLGVAYTLKALSEWRLGDLGGDLAMLDAARTTVAEAEAVQPPEDLALGTRDRVVLRAIAGVSDVARGRLSKAAYAAPSGPRECLQSAIRTLDRALDVPGLPAEHEVRVWVHLSQLRACQQWLAATGTLTGAEMDAERPAIWAEWERCARELAGFYKGNAALQDAVRRSGATMGIPGARIEAIVAPTGLLPAAPALRTASELLGPDWLAVWTRAATR